MDLFLNPVVLSVIVMLVLCLFKLNIILALLISALVAGGVAFMPGYMAAGAGAFGAFTQAMSHTIGTLVNGMGGQSNTALSYILLGALAVALGNTGLTGVLCDKITRIVGKKGLFLLLLIAFISCFSQNLVPVHIAFIPILIPPLLSLFNQLKIDRRAVACSLTFGLKAPYIALPAGFGLIFQGILSDEMAKSGVEIARNSVWHYTWFLGVAMLVGLLIAIFFSYRKPREYQDLPLEGIDLGTRTTFKFSDLLTLVALVVAVVVQIKLDSLPLAALSALILMFVFGQLKWKDIEDTMKSSIGIMGMIAIIMLVASGFGDVIRETKAVDQLVNGVVTMVGGSKAIGTFLMLLVGLLITMGIGTSFGTIPVVAAIYVPLGIKLGLTPGAICCILAAAAALGDAGSPASDSTLGPTSGLNFDGQHDHIWDTCVPTFLHYNILLIIGGMIGALVVFA